MMAEDDKDEVVETEAAEAEAPAREGPAGEAPEAERPLHPKVARKRARSRHTGEAGPSRSAEDRQAERAATRAAKAAARRRGREKARAKQRERRGPTPEPTPPAGRTPARQKVRQGVVVSAKPDKTIAVRIDLTRRHPRYEKTVRTSTTLHAHDEANDANAGDTVRVVECRPLSRTKRWRLLEVLERAK